METIFSHKYDYIKSNIELVIYSMVSFFVPFLLGHPQWLVGTIVNSSLVLAGLNYKNWKILPVVILPSLAVLSRGIIFGPFTIFLLYLIPSIWLGNFVLAYFARKKTLGVALGIVTKVVILFGSAFVMVKLSILPPIFLVSMGLLQVYTAVAGAIVALGINKIKG